MGKPRKITDEREALQCLFAVEAEGSQFTRGRRAHGIDARSLNARRMAFARRDVTGSRHQ